MIEKKVVVNLAVGISARRRLDEFARSTGLPLGVVLERAIMAYEPAVSVAPNEPRMTALESRIEALESAFKALTVESAPSYQPNIEAAEIGSCVAVGHDPNVDDVGTLEADHPVISEVKESPETGGMEKEAVPIPPPILSNTHQGDKPRAFAELPESDKQHWRGVMLDWQRTGLSNPAISKRLWDEQRIGQYSFGKLAALDRNRTKTEIDRAKGIK